ncbi:MAG: hypothetical protein KDB03_16075 [Planctomycetales bacterium]|nr:hypothetical protein [Planctomycetales bacterium]
MNWSMLAVLTAVLILLPIAMYGVFNLSRDSYDYQRHYDQKGYSAELPEDYYRNNSDRDIKAG